MSKKLTEEQRLKHNAAQKRHYARTKEKKLAYCKNRYKENSPEILAQQANYRVDNRDAINARRRANYHAKQLAEKLAILQGNNI